MGLFDKPKIPGLDAASLNRINQRNLANQKNLISERGLRLRPLSEQFRTERANLSGQIEPGTENILSRYRQELGQVGAKESEAAANAGRTFREQAFRDVPELQRAIRSSLGGSRLLASGAAAGRIAEPIIGAARSSRDFSAGLEQNRLQNEVGREENLAQTGFGARSNALAARLGLDEGTINALNEMGRGDLLQEYQDLLGAQETFGANELSIEQARQANAIAQAQAAASRRGNIISGLAQLSGAGIGAAFGGAPGAAIGGQLGGTFGQLATGSPVQFDPTLLYAFSQRNPARRTAIVNSFGGQVPTYAPSYREMGF